jgi:hypothetical protein
MYSCSTRLAVPRIVEISNFQYLSWRFEGEFEASGQKAELAQAEVIRVAGNFVLSRGPKGREPSH